MQKIAELMQAKAIELLQSGKAEKVLAWRAGEFFYDNAPAAFESVEACKEIVYNEFCPANLAKYLIETTKQQKKTVVFLKPCDTYGVNQLLKDNRIKREYIYAVGTPCSGMLDEKKIVVSINKPDAQRRVYMKDLERRAMDTLGRRVKINQTAKKRTVELWLKVIVGVIPAAIVGFLLDDFLEEHLYSFIVVAI